MYLGTCFGVQRSNIDNKNTIDGLIRLTNNEQTKFKEGMIIKTIRDSSLNLSALMRHEDFKNLKKSTQEKP
jgi:hypothetical protein